MKSHILTILTTTVLLTSCFEHVKNQSSANSSKKTEIYTGPIIDMHIHAFVEESPFYGMSHPLSNKRKELSKSSMSIK